jgi:hypothetical protein
MLLVLAPSAAAVHPVTGMITLDVMALLPPLSMDVGKEPNLWRLLSQCVILLVQRKRLIRTLLVTCSMCQRRIATGTKSRTLVASRMIPQ